MLFKELPPVFFRPLPLMCLCLSPLAAANVPSPQSYVVDIGEARVLSELPVGPVCQPHVPSTGIFGFPQGERENSHLKASMIHRSVYLINLHVFNLYAVPRNAK